MCVDCNCGRSDPEAVVVSGVSARPDPDRPDHHQTPHHHFSHGHLPHDHPHDDHPQQELSQQELLPQEVAPHRDDQHRFQNVSSHGDHHHVEPASPLPSQLPLRPRVLTLAERLLAHNDAHAAVNRQRFAAAGVRVVNLLSSPGSGKTALLERLAGAARGAMAVIVGDLATDNDARRLRAAGLPAVQITTGQACHLEAAMVQRAVDALEAQGQPLAALELLLIENVGNLVCPAAYDLGENLRLVLLAAGEGEDKPLKYPALFHSADLVVISKIDLAAAVAFDRPQALRAIATVAPQAQVFECSARTGAGIEALLAALLPVPPVAVPPLPL